MLRYDNKIEAIITNDDYLSLGAIEALQSQGFNASDKLKYIPVVGISGIPEAKQLIDKGVISGTVIEDTKELANDLYSIGMNLINNIDPIENTNLKFENGEIILLQNPKKYIG